MHRFSMALTLFALCLMISGVGMLCANAQEALPETERAERLKYAKAYLEAVPPSQVMKQMSASLTRRLPEKNREDVQDFMENEMDLDQIEAINLQLLTERFTAEELKAMADFYNSEVGQSIHRKTPEYSMQLFHEIFPVMLRSVQEHLRRKNGGPSLEADTADI